MTRRPTQDDLTQRVDELQARLAAIEQNQASGASGDPERTTRRDMFRRAGITAAGVVGGAAGLSLLNAQTVHANTGTGQAVQLGDFNYAGDSTFVVNTSGTGTGLGGSGHSLGVGGFASTGSGADTNSVGVYGHGSGAGVAGHGSFLGVRGTGAFAGVAGEGTSGFGVAGFAANTGVFGLGSGGGAQIGVAGSGITGVLGSAGSGFGVKGVATGSGAGVIGSAFAGVVGVGAVPTGSGAYSPDVVSARSGRIWQAFATGAGNAPSFPSVTGIGESVRSADGLLWVNDNNNNWLPATFGGWGISLFSAQITSQPTLANSNGTTWQPIDPGLTLTITPTFNCDALLKLTGAPWTNQAGANQDIGIVVGTSAYTPSASAPNGWTESGGTSAYSPNGAVTEAIVGLTAGTTYHITAVWKANVSTTATLFLGAGPHGGPYSPTRLTAHLLADSALGAGAVTKHGPAPARISHASKIQSRVKAKNGSAAAAAPAKRSAPKAAAARKAKLTSKPAPKRAAPRTKR